MKAAVWKPLEVLSEGQQAALRDSLASIGGPARESACWAIEHHWRLLCVIAERYAEDEPDTENWKDAEVQWRRVREAADELTAALEGLGDLAHVAPQFLPGFGLRFNLDQDSNAVHHLRAWASSCEEASRQNKEQFNGSKRGATRKMKDGTQQEVRTPQLAMLLSGLLDLLKGKPQAHAQRMAGAIHAWAFPRDREKAMGPRFTERAMKLVRKVRSELGNTNPRGN